MGREDLGKEISGDEEVPLHAAIKHAAMMRSRCSSHMITTVSLGLLSHPEDALHSQELDPKMVWRNNKALRVRVEFVHVGSHCCRFEDLS